MVLKTSFIFLYVKYNISFLSLEFGVSHERLSVHVSLVHQGSFLSTTTTESPVRVNNKVTNTFAALTQTCSDQGQTRSREQRNWSAASCWWVQWRLRRVSGDVTTVRTHSLTVLLLHSVTSLQRDHGWRRHVTYVCSSTQLAVRRIIALRLTVHHVCDMERTSAFKHH